MPREGSRATHCLRGHPLKGRNCRVTPDGKRHCRQCQYDRDAAIVGRSRETHQTRPLRDPVAQVKRKERLKALKRYRDPVGRVRMLASRAAYYARNREAISERRRKRYASDAEYRAQCSERMRDWYARTVGHAVRPTARTPKLAALKGATP